MIKGSARPESITLAAIKFLDKYPLKIEIQRSQIFSNGQNGIVVQDFWKGPVIIEKTKVLGNKQYGVYLAKKYKNSKEEKAVMATSPGSCQLGSVCINQSVITRNEASGLCIVKVLTTLTETSITENANFAIHIPKESYKKYIKVINPDRAHEFIKGTIGGEWGVCYTGKPGLCISNNTNCRLL